ncbi:MAG: hypothetical protein ACTJGD_00410 [Mesonia hippocampi]|uniref:hypothetical protein n=1 Tax=Mesonia hippocampi TaxID=1628250 RepID=UPI003F97BC88
MRNKFLVHSLLFFGALLLVSCKEEAAKEALPVLAKEQLEKKVVLSTNFEVLFNQKSKTALNNWASYLTLDNEVDRIKSATVKDILSNSNSLLVAIDSVAATTPTDFKNKPIAARIKTLKVKAAMLKQLNDFHDFTPEEVEQYAQEVYIAYQNFQLQLNEVYLEGLRDFEKNFDRIDSGVALDSVSPTRSLTQPQVQNINAMKIEPTTRKKQKGNTIRVKKE